MHNPEPATGSGHEAFAPLDSRGGAFTTTALRSALQAQIRGGDAQEPPDLRRLARLLALEAHRRTLRPEQIVVTVKQVWLTLPEAHLSATTVGTRLVDRLIGLFIEEFYRRSDDR